jgi:hypothetical protein
MIRRIAAGAKLAEGLTAKMFPAVPRQNPICCQIKYINRIPDLVCAVFN